jgi:hypothetical protein
MSSSRTLDCETIITLYAERFKIEGLFGELKNRLGGFACHFWTYALEKRKKGALPVLPKDKKMLKDVQMVKKSIETYVFCQCLSYVILTGLGLTESTGWLRTVRAAEPRGIEDFTLKSLRMWGNKSPTPPVLRPRGAGN